MKPEEFFSQVKLNYATAEKAYKELKSERWNEVDGLYRVYHQSFKMYYECQEYIIDSLNVLFTLIGIAQEKLEHGLSVKEKLRQPQEHCQNLEEKLIKLELDKYFTRTVLESLKLNYDSNDENVWFEHQKSLTAAAYHAKIGIESVMTVAKRYIKKNYLPGEDGGGLEPYEALAEHLLNFESYRWQGKEELKKRIKKTEKAQSSVQ
jgi:hypothetical protein